MSRRAVSFCFDDGYRATAQTAIDIFSARDLKACFCILAAPDLTADPYILASEIADWDFWRSVAGAGHEVAPHGFAHERLQEMPPADALASVQRTIEKFALEFPGFEPKAQLFHAPYLTAPAPVVAWVADRMLGVRLSLGRQGANKWDVAAKRRCVDCVTFGPDDVDSQMRNRISAFLKSNDDWLVLVCHGLDGEGWGPLRSETLARLLDELRGHGIEIAPPGALLKRAIAISSD